MRIAVVVGGDRCGKTTLTEEFIRRGWTYRHFAPPKKSPYEEYMEFAKLLEENAGSGGKYVVDRYMYCEFPYSQHYGRKTDMTLERMAEIEKILLKIDPKAAVVYCETGLESNWKRIQEEGKGEFKSVEELERLRNEYKRVLGESSLALVKYDFTAGCTPEETVDKIEGMPWTR